MSNDVVKNTINSLVNKYSGHPLTNSILVPALKLPEMEEILTELMKQHQSGNPFAPTFANLFKPFDIFCTLAKDTTRSPKVIIVNSEPYSNLKLNDGIALSFPTDTIPAERPIEGIEFAKARLFVGGSVPPKPDLESLCNQQVLMLNIALTRPANGSHFDLWAPVTTEIIRQVSLLSPNAIWLFIGEKTEPFRQVLGTDSLKFFVPEITQGWDHNDVLKKINDLLLKNNRSTIAW